MTYFILTFLAIIFLSYYWVWYSSPELPSNTDALIQEVMSSELPEFMTGKSGFAKNGAIKICYEFSKRNGLNAKANDQHSYAIKKSGSRYEELKNIKAPTLVIHGTADTLILVNHAKKYAPMIPDAELLLFEGMGHDLPKEQAPKVVSKILSLLERVNKKETSLK